MVGSATKSEKGVLSLCITKYHTTKVSGGVEVPVGTSLTSVQDGGKH